MDGMFFGVQSYLLTRWFGILGERQVNLSEIVKGDRVLSRTESSVFSKVAVFNYPSSDPKDPMGLEYLPTFAKKNNHPCRKMYQSPWVLWVNKFSSSNGCKKNINTAVPPSPGGIEEGGHIAPIYKRQTIEGPSVACLQRGNNENKQTSKQTNKQTNKNQNQSQTKPNQQQKHDLISVSVILMSLLPSNSLSFITGRVVMDQVIWTHLSYKLKIWIPSVVGKPHVLQTHVWSNAGTIVGQ